MYAVVVSGGKQFKVSEGDVIEVEKLDGSVGDKVEMPVLMTVDGDKVVTGEEVKATVSAEILSLTLGSVRSSLHAWACYHLQFMPQPQQVRHT